LATQAAKNNPIKRDIEYEKVAASKNSLF